MKMKKLAIYQSDLKVGGIQRSLVNLLKSGYLNNYLVDVYLFDKDIFFDLTGIKDNIKIHYLKPLPYWYRMVPFPILNKFVKVDVDEQYDYVIDFDGYRQDCALYVIQHKKSNKIVWIHNDIEKEYKYKLLYRILFFFFKRKFNLYDIVVGVSEGTIAPFKRMTKCEKKKYFVIPNIIDSNEIIEKSKSKCSFLVDKNKINIICVGRICLQKGYDYLLRDFKEAYSRNDKLRLYIVGDGPDKVRYENWVRSNKLDKVVIFTGNLQNPFSLEKEMDAFCMESRFEGQGIVFWEAKVLGLQVIFPKRLEKYNSGLYGTDNIINELAEMDKKEKNIDMLTEYHKNIQIKLTELLSSNAKK